MDALARQGVLFERAFTPAPITLPAHASMFTGLLPPAHGVRGNGAFALGPGSPTLAEALRPAGRRTAAFVGGFPLARRFGLDRGFDHYDDAMGKAPGMHYEFAERRGGRRGGGGAGLAGRPARAPCSSGCTSSIRTRPTIRRRPIAAPIPIAARSRPRTPRWRALLAAWDARPEPSVVALTADHGEAFGEHGEESHSLFVYDTTLRVPLLVRGARAGRGPPGARPGGLQDLAATLLDLAGSAGGLPGLTGGPSCRARGWPTARSTPRPWRRAWSSGGATCAPGATGASSTSARRGPSCTTWRPTPARPATSSAVPSRGGRAAGRGALPGAGGAGRGRRAAGPRIRRRAERLRALGYAQGPEGRGSGADPKDKVEVARRIARAAGPFPDAAAAAARLPRDRAPATPRTRS